MLIKGIYWGRIPISTVYRSEKIIWRHGTEKEIDLRYFISSYKDLIITEAASGLIYTDYRIALEKNSILSVDRAKLGEIDYVFSAFSSSNLQTKETQFIGTDGSLKLCYITPLKFQPSKIIPVWLKNNFIIENKVVFSNSKHVIAEDLNQLKNFIDLKTSQSTRGRIDIKNLIGHKNNISVSASKRIIIIAEGITLLKDKGTAKIIPSKRVIVKNSQFFGNHGKKEISPSKRINIKDQILFTDSFKIEISPSKRLNIFSNFSFTNFGKLQSSEGVRAIIIDDFYFKNKTLLNSSPSKTIQVFSKGQMAQFGILRSSRSILHNVENFSHIFLNGKYVQSKSYKILVPSSIDPLSLNIVKVSLSLKMSSNILIKSLFDFKVFLSETFDVQTNHKIKSLSGSICKQTSGFYLKPEKIVCSESRIQYKQIAPTNISANKIITSNSMTNGITSYPSLNDFFLNVLSKTNSRISIQKQMLTRIKLFLSINDKNNLISSSSSIGTIEKYVQFKNQGNISSSLKQNALLKTRADFLNKVSMNYGEYLYINDLDNKNQFLNIAQLNQGASLSLLRLKNETRFESNSILSFSDSWQYPIQNSKTLFVTQVSEASYFEDIKTLVLF